MKASDEDVLSGSVVNNIKVNFIYTSYESQLLFPSISKKYPGSRWWNILVYLSSLKVNVLIPQSVIMQTLLSDKN